MQRLLGALLVAGALVGGVYFVQNFEIDPAGLSIRPRAPSAADSNSGGPEGASRSGETIRIASFNIQVFGTAKLNKPQVVDILAQIVRQFDIVAIQEVRSKDDTILPRFVDLVNATGRRYDFAIGPRLGRTSSKEQYAFVFDTERIEIDRGAVYTVDDPDDLLHREPLVGAFRVRGPPAEEAFTFSLVNIHTDPDEVKTELNALDDVVRAVRNDGRGEDDVILLGDLNADDAHLGELGEMSNGTWAISGMATNTRGTKMYDNILFDRLATSEYDGRSGVVDFTAQLQLSLEQALEVSDHRPIWAEFSGTEGGRGGPLAARPLRAAK